MREKVKAGTDLTGLSKANNNGFNEPFSIAYPAVTDW
jgi:hypothetical protein